MRACSCVTLKMSTRPKTSVILFRVTDRTHLSRPDLSGLALQHHIGQLNCNYNKKKSCLGMDQDIVW